jgi:adenylyltransferase/sulfurtransferase
MSRLSRQILLPGFGAEAQARLQQAKVLVIGAGGLGCPALQYLAAAGVGHISIVDGDRVSLSNLNRQILFGEENIGEWKATVAARKLAYSDIRIAPLNVFISNQNALSLIASHDLVIDGSDNFPTRYLVNDACALLGKPLVLGAIYQYEGQVMLLNAGPHPCHYRDLYPHPPAAHEIPNCHETGVLGVLPGIIGCMMAAEAIKFLSGVGETLRNKVLFYHLLNHTSFQISLSPQAQHRGMPSTSEAFEKHDYALQCGISASITWEEALQMPNLLLIDIREDDERPLLEDHAHQRMPLSAWQESQLLDAGKIALFCQSGMRSAKKALALQARFPEKHIYTIEGGIKAYFG